METLLVPAMSHSAHDIEPPPMDFNFASHLFFVNRARAEKRAYIDDVGETTYGELEQRARRVAAALLSLGIRAEERVLLAMLDTVELPITFLGALYAGIVPVVVNTLLTADDYAYMLENSRSRAVIASGAILPTVTQALDALEPGSRLLLVSGEVSQSSPTALHFQSIIDQIAPASEGMSTRRDDIAFWLYSSGSTGKPKGTVHTHSNLYWTVETYAKQVLGIRESDVVFSAAKLFFAYGLGNGLTFPLSVGATAILMAERPTVDAVIERLVKYRPTVFYGVPTLYASMMAAPNLPSREKVNLRICTSAGEALPKEVGERFTAHFGAEILDGIGSTEMLHIFLSNRIGDVQYGTTGTPVPGYEIEIRDESGHIVPDGEMGDLYIKGPSSAIMYWSNREKSRATFLGEWVRSGDKYQKMPNGRFKYGGRSDDMLKVSGQYVSPIEVEMTLVQHEAVLEAAVIGVDQDGLVKTRAFVVLKGSYASTEVLRNELKAFVKQRLAPHKYPREIIFVEDLPKTATGKIQRYKLRDGITGNQA